MRLWKILKKLFLWLVALPILLFFMIYNVTWAYVLYKQPKIDAKIQNIEVVLWEDLLPVNINVPVRYIAKGRVLGNSYLLIDKNGEKFYFGVDKNDPDKFWIQKFTLLPCHIHFSAKYEITDSSVEKQLIELSRTKPFEVLWAEKQEREKEKAPESSKTPE